MRPAAISPRTCSGVRCFSRSATRRISGVTTPSRACSSCVTGEDPSGATQRPPSRRQPAGMKSHAVLSLGSGMPGVSGDENERGPPMSARFAKEPGVVPWATDDGLKAPRSGSVRWVMRSSTPLLDEGRKRRVAPLPSAGANRIRFHGCVSAAFAPRPERRADPSPHQAAAVASQVPVRRGSRTARRTGMIPRRTGIRPVLPQSKATRVVAQLLVTQR